MPTPDLGGACILVTRPAHQAGPLAARIAALGGQALLFPVLEIQPTQHPDRLAALLARLPEYRLAIFISANAVEYGMPWLLGRGPLPGQLALAAVGRATAAALDRLGCPASVVPHDEANSEALLALPRLHQVAGQRVLIVRGEGGRELLADTLRGRGAVVDYAEVYRRVHAKSDVKALNEQGVRGAIHIATATSNEGLQALVDAVGETGRAWLLQTPLVVVSPRQAELAQRLGFTHPATVAATAGDAALVQAVLRCRSQYILPNKESA